MRRRKLNFYSTNSSALAACPANLLPLRSEMR